MYIQYIHTYMYAMLCVGMGKRGKLGHCSPSCVDAGDPFLTMCRRPNHNVNAALHPGLDAAWFWRTDFDKAEGRVDDPEMQGCSERHDGSRLSRGCRRARVHQMMRGCVIQYVGSSYRGTNNGPFAPNHRSGFHGWIVGKTLKGCSEACSLSYLGR
jgi:hypothetical protein